VSTRKIIQLDNFFHLPLDDKVEVRRLIGGTDYEQCYKNAAHQARCLDGKDKPVTIVRGYELDLEIAVGAELMSFNEPEGPVSFVFQSILWTAYSIEPLSERGFAFLIKARASEIPYAGQSPHRPTPAP